MLQHQRSWHAICKTTNVCLLYPLFSVSILTINKELSLRRRLKLQVNIKALFWLGNELSYHCLDYQLEILYVPILNFNTVKPVTQPAGYTAFHYVMVRVKIEGGLYQRFSKQRGLYSNQQFFAAGSIQGRVIIEGGQCYRFYGTCLIVFISPLSETF